VDQRGDVPGRIHLGILANSTALLADSVDMLGDAIEPLRRGPWGGLAGSNGAAEGLIMAVFDGAVLAQIGVNVLRGLVPAAEVMGGIGLLAFIANGACLALLCVVASTTLTCAPLGSAR
jgi:hypothetical protein